MPRSLPVLFALSLLLLSAFSPPAAIAEDKWIEVRSAHFTVYTPVSEKDGRKIATQFEEIRALFHAAFPALRTDPAQPIVILAVKSEKGMKELLPEQWEVKGHLHAAGLYQQGFDKHYVILQLDAEGNNPYHALYHEYTHALMHLNFANLPLWLDEGLAEYLGNASIGDKESNIGVVDPGNLYVLQQNRPLPIETLLGVDHTSPYYNESNRASIFYAESWALVHYLMLAPEARQKQLLQKFLLAWSTTRDPLEAARQTFGDLKKFGQVLDSYARQGNFYHGVVKNAAEGADLQFTSRSISPAEVEALRGDFFVHHNRLDAGKPLLEDAAKLDPALPFPHAALASYYFRSQDLPDVQKEAAEAVRLGDTGFFPPYLEAISLMRDGIMPPDASGHSDSLTQVTALLEKSHKLNPNFAPALDALANVYSISPDKQADAVKVSILAVRLDPTDLQYSVHLTRLLLNNNRDADAKTMSDKITAEASTPQERAMAASIADLVARHREHSSSQDGEVNASAPTTSGTIAFKGPGGTYSSGPSGAISMKNFTVGIEGTLAEVNCSKNPEISLEINPTGGELALHIADVAKIAITPPANAPVPSCPQWSGHHVRLWFRPQVDPKQPGEVAKLDFQ